MSKLRKRAVKNIKKRYKSKVTLKQAQKVWRDWVEYGVVVPLLKYGKVQIDQNFSIEIVGKKMINDPKIYGLVVNGLSFNGIKKQNNFGDSRRGIKYKIVVKDKNYTKGQLIFEADKKLSKRVHEQLKNTNQYYRIEQ